MGLITVLSCIYLVFTFILYMKKKELGNVFMIFGGTTFLAVFSYCYIPGVYPQLQRFMIFISFSLYILNFGLMIGLLIFIKSRKMKKSICFSILSSLLLIISLFNIKGFFEYMYIPVLLYMIQGKVNEIIYECN